MRGNGGRFVRLLTGAAVVGAVLAGAVFLGPALLGHTQAAKEQRRGDVEVPVTVAPVVARTVERRVGVVGTLEGFEEVQISAKVEGRVLRVRHDVGDEVAPGEPLCEIDPTDYQLAANEAERGLEMELARIGLSELCGKEKLDLGKIPTVTRARNLEESARQTLERARRLNSNRVISAEELEKAQTESRVATANRIQAELDARAALAAARLKHAQLESARQKIADAKVCAPALSPGRLPQGLDAKKLRFVVASRKVAEGEICRVFPSGTIFRLVIDRPLKLVAQAPERFVGEVAIGQAVSLVTEAYPGETFAGRITRLNPTVDRDSRAFTVEVMVPNEDRRLRVGSFVKASILTRQAVGAATVPEEAVHRFAGVVKVFVIESGRARVAAVRTGEVIVTEGRRWVEVAGEVKPGDQVALTGHSQLAQGARVAVRQGEPRAFTSP
jgi:multidrug efflux pump subunit AcrA (membrane-fusion protein)